jgi:hypothetical protein
VIEESPGGDECSDNSPEVVLRTAFLQADSRLPVVEGLRGVAFPLQELVNVDVQVPALRFRAEDVEANPRAAVHERPVSRSRGQRPSLPLVGLAAYNLSGTGQVSAGNQYVGYSGAGTVNQSGGTNSVSATGNLYVGYNGGGSGTYNLGGNGLLSAPSKYIGYSGSGSLTQTGGTQAVSGFFMLGSNSNLALGSRSWGSYSLGAAPCPRVTRLSGPSAVAASRNRAEPTGFPI